MSAAAPRTISNAPDVRQLGVAVGALILAVALLVAVTVSRPASSASTAPLAAPAPAVHDRGWEAAPLAAPAHDNGWEATGAAEPGLVISGTQGGGIQYTGIPYSAPDSTPVSGGRGTRFAR
jgi:hypothetical protein